MRLGRFARVPLTHAPTPLEPLRRLSQLLGGPNLFVKRDDCTGLASGGNKTRKLEFLVAEALAQGATHIVTQGATQSNHVRQTAAAAARFGLKCTALLEERVSGAEAAYYHNGNVLLDQLFGCEVLHRPGSGLDMNAEMVPVADALRAKGEIPYLIPGGGSNAIGALGYVVCAQEIMAQADAMGIVFDYVVTATGSAGTHAGLVAGLAGMNSGIPVLGVGVRAPRETQEANVYRLGEAVWQLLGLPGSLPRESIVANCDYVGAGYGQATPGMIEAVRLLAQQEGLLLDPVYSGKAMAGLIDLIRQGHFKPGQNVLFLHTGGSVGLFGYQQVLQR